MRRVAAFFSAAVLALQHADAAEPPALPPLAADHVVLADLAARPNTNWRKFVVGEIRPSFALELKRTW